MRPRPIPSRRGEDAAPQDEVRVRESNPEKSYVTQRPGWSSFATSVSTLTVGSQATAILRSGLRSTGLVATGAGAAGARFRASLGRGRRTSTEVSDRPSSLSRMVCVDPDEAGIL